MHGEAACPIPADENRIGSKICNMTNSEFEQMLDRVAKSGAKAALADVGLVDPDAASDIQTIRDMLKGFRVFKAEAWSVTIKGLGRIIGWAVVLSIAALFFKSGGPAGQHIAQKILEP